MKIIYTNTIDNLKEIFEPYREKIGVDIANSVMDHMRNIHLNMVYHDKDTCIFRIEVNCRDTRQAKEIEKDLLEDTIEYQMNYSIQDLLITRNDDTLNITIQFTEICRDSIFYLTRDIHYKLDKRANINVDTDIVFNFSEDNSTTITEDRLLSVDTFKVLSFPDDVLLDTLMIFKAEDEIKVDVERGEEETLDNRRSRHYNYTSLALMLGKMMNSISNHSLVIDNKSDINFSRLTRYYANLGNDFQSKALENRLKALIVDSQDHGEDVLTKDKENMCKI